MLCWCVGLRWAAVAQHPERCGDATGLLGEKRPDKGAKRANENTLDGLRMWPECYPVGPRHPPGYLVWQKLKKCHFVWNTRGAPLAYMRRSLTDYVSRITNYGEAGRVLDSGKFCGCMDHQWKLFWTYHISRRGWQPNCCLCEASDCPFRCLFHCFYICILFARVDVAIFHSRCCYQETRSHKQRELTCFLFQKYARRSLLNAWHMEAHKVGVVVLLELATRADDAKWNVMAIGLCALSAVFRIWWHVFIPTKRM